MGLLDDIRNQPPHIREIFMWLCVVITFSVVSFFWLKSEAHQVVALLNPQEQSETGPAFAGNDTKVQNSSLFGDIGRSASGFKNSFLDFLGLGKKASPTESGSVSNHSDQTIPPQLFPTSNNK